MGAGDAEDKMLKEVSDDGGCAGCHGPITERFYLLAADRQWHLGCLQCAECKLALDTELTCYFRHGNIYCKHDYYRGVQPLSPSPKVFEPLVKNIYDLIFYLVYSALHHPSRNGFYYMLNRTNYEEQ
ncbi:unnamed protein product [Nezara viridula]|uniref:LIM zinc-binding domain-containing protein n=1 Tax=Nezara viridula TaxID=85310 RepID=A0A9P0E6V8_NEZVI|nr:unnamed protein product [Nezara viridula]